jgi:hypothetical protein
MLLALHLSCGQPVGELDRVRACCLMPAHRQVSETMFLYFGSWREQLERNSQEIVFRTVATRFPACQVMNVDFRLRAFASIADLSVVPDHRAFEVVGPW